MNNRCSIRFAGSGGQGVILASVFMAEAAVMNGYKTMQFQNYGPEVRGGMCQAYTIFSDEEILFPHPERFDVLLALTQAALNNFSMDTGQTSVIITDSGLSVPEHCPAAKVFCIPILKTAEETVGRPMTANVVATAAINSSFDFFPDDTMWEAIKKHIPVGSEAYDMKAYEEGRKLGKNLL
jgi:2-oxoglutarate ferredoxin oxidoreductase subunit gamma